MTRSEALDAARKLCRTLDASPDPRRQAQALAAGLLKASGWSSAAEAEITAFAQWVAGRPSPSALKPRAQALLRLIG